VRWKQKGLKANRAKKKVGFSDHPLRPYYPVAKDDRRQKVRGGEREQKKWRKTQNKTSEEGKKKSKEFTNQKKTREGTIA